MDPELQRIFDYATSQGVNVFDTADSYGTGALNGRSEELLGRFMRENGAIRGGAPVHIATKLAAYPWRATPWNMTAACRCAHACCPCMCFFVVEYGGAVPVHTCMLPMHAFFVVDDDGRVPVRTGMLPMHECVLWSCFKLGVHT